MKRKKTISDYVKLARRKNFMTQEQMAEYFETNQGNISKMENGWRNVPKDKVEWLAHECGVSIKSVRDAWAEFYDEWGVEVL